MTAVTVKLTNGNTRSFLTEFTTPANVESVALANLPLVHSLSGVDRAELVNALHSVFDGSTVDSVLKSELLASAGIESVTVGYSTPDEAAEASWEDTDDDVVPTSEDLPVYAATIDAQHRESDSNLTPEAAQFLSTLKSSPVKSTPEQFKPKGWRIRHVAAAYSVAGVLVGIAAGALLF